MNAKCQVRLQAAARFCHNNLGSAGALRWQPLTDSRVIGWIAAYALGRSLMEEFVFRAMALPHPKVKSHGDARKENAQGSPKLSYLRIVSRTCAG